MYVFRAAHTPPWDLAKLVNEILTQVDKTGSLTSLCRIAGRKAIVGEEGRRKDESVIDRTAVFTTHYFIPVKQIYQLALGCTPHVQYLFNAESASAQFGVGSMLGREPTRGRPN